jgi:hypothetical protein
MTTQEGEGFWDKKLREDSIKYLFWKGAGGLFTAGIAIVVAWAAVGSLNISNTIRLSNELTQKNLQISEKDSVIESLRLIANKYRASRFIIHKFETKILFDDVYFHFDGNSRNDYSIFKYKTRLADGTNLPSVTPDTFIVGDEKYCFIAERVFTNDWLADSALIYWDCLTKPAPVTDLH